MVGGWGAGGGGVAISAVLRMGSDLLAVEALSTSTPPPPLPPPFPCILHVFLSEVCGRHPGRIGCGDV